MKEAVDDTRGEELFNEIEDIFKKHSAVFSDISSIISNGYIPWIEVIKKHIDFLEMSLKHVALSLGIESHIRVDSVPQLRDLYNNLVLRNVEIQKEKRLFTSL
ncbi:MAG: hypothetical protein IPH20_14385 [Bacteroidales bacterium]|nr:hypothetical protein [Bacteroidales bacterium]